MNERSIKLTKAITTHRLAAWMEENRDATPAQAEAEGTRIYRETEARMVKHEAMRDERELLRPRRHAHMSLKFTLLCALAYNNTYDHAQLKPGWYYEPKTRRPARSR